MNWTTPVTEPGTSIHIFTVLPLMAFFSLTVPSYAVLSSLRSILRNFSVAENMLSWPHSGFHVHLGPVIHAEEREELKKTARYGARAPLALSRLTYNREKEQVSYVYTNPYDHAEYTEKVTPHELIARLMAHIPDPWEQTTKYYG